MRIGVRLTENKPILGQTVWILTAIQVAHVLDFVIMMPLGPQLMRDFEIGPMTFGYLVSTYTFSAAISSFTAAKWLDNYDRKQTLLLLMVGFVISTSVCAISTNAYMFAFGRLLAGVFGGVIGANCYAIISEVVPVDARGKAMGMLSVAFPVVSVAGVPIGLYLADRLSWHVSFWFVVILALVFSVWAFKCLPRVPPTQDEEKNASDSSSFFASYISILGHKPHLVGILTIIPIVFGGFTIVPYIAPFLVGNEIILESQLPIIYLIGGAVTIFTSRLIGNSADKYGKVKVLTFTCILAIIAILNFTTLTRVPFFIVIISATFCMAALPGRLISVMAMLSIVAKPENRGAYMALVSSIQQCSIGLASILGGMFIVEGSNGEIIGYWQVGVIAASFNILAMMGGFYLKKLEPSL